MNSFILATFAVLLGFSNAYAYIDPVSGSIIFQSIIAIVAAILFFVKTNLAKIKVWFSSKKNDEANPAEKNTPEE